MSAIAEIRQLADRLARRAGSGARLTPESAKLAMIALRVYADLLEQPSIDGEDRPYEVAVFDANDHRVEIIALCRNALIGKAAYEEAVKQRPRQHIMLTRGAQVHGDSARERQERAADVRAG